MSVKKNEIDKFLNSFENNIVKFTDTIKEHSQSKESEEVVELYQDCSLSEKIEGLIIQLNCFSQKSGINIYVGKIGCKFEKK